MKLWTTAKPKDAAQAGPAYPGILQALDGSAAVVAMETAASEAAGAYRAVSLDRPRSDEPAHVFVATTFAREG